MDTTPAMDAALNADRVTFFVAVQLDLPAPNTTVRLVDAGEVTWSQGAFKSIDATFGTIDNIEDINDGEGDQAPQLAISFIPSSSASAADICSPAFQGSRIRLWLGALDGAGAVVADPYLMFDGEIDQPTLSIDAGQRQIDMECASAFERLFADDEGIRLNSSNHKNVWPGETGLDDMTGIVRQVLWGPGKKLTSTPTNGYSGGGFGGGSHGRYTGANISLS